MTTRSASRPTWSTSSATQRWKFSRAETRRRRRASATWKWRTRKRRLTSGNRQRATQQRPTSESHGRTRKGMLELMTEGDTRSRPSTFHYRMFVSSYLCWTLKQWYRLQFTPSFFFSVFITDPRLQPSENSSDSRNQPAPHRPQMLGDKQSTKFTVHLPRTGWLESRIKANMFHRDRIKF